MCTSCKTLPLDTATALKPSVLTHSKQHDGKTLGLPVREKKEEEFLHFSWDLLERLHDMDLHRPGPYSQLSQAPCVAHACQIDLIHANVSAVYPAVLHYNAVSPCGLRAVQHRRRTPLGNLAKRYVDDVAEFSKKGGTREV